MRRTFFTGGTSLLVLTCLMHGCQEPGLSTSLEDGPQANTSAELADPDALAVQAYEQAKLVAERANASMPQDTQQIIWRDLAMEPAASNQSPPQHSPGTAEQVDTSAVARFPGSEAEAQPETEAAPTPPDQAQAHIQTVANTTKQATATATTKGLSLPHAYAQMLHAIQESDDPNLTKAINAATLGAAGPHGELDWTLLRTLSPQDQQRVQRYHQAVSMLRDEALAGKGPIDQSTVGSKLEEVFGNQPVTIRTIRLCERVSGYGVYDAFPDNTFVAGREQKVIVYVELDNFMPADRGQGEGYEVRLRQELELYESNGYEVWSHEPVDIVDVSKNKRRDFFVVQLASLPAQLALGEYRLKVRIYDENAGTRDETSIKINVVADDTLVQKTR